MDDDPLTRLRDHLQELLVSNGRPSQREISKRTSKAISHATVGKVLGCKALPRLGQVELVVEALGGDAEEFKPLWRDAYNSQASSETSNDTRRQARFGYGTPLTTDEQTDLVTLLAKSPQQATATAAAIAVTVANLPEMLDFPMSNWFDSNSVVAQVEEIRAAQEHPLFVLMFADALAHITPATIAWKLHGWVDTVGVRLGFDQSTMRDLCRSSRDVTSGINKAPGRQCLEKPASQVYGQPSNLEATPTTTDEPPGETMAPGIDISPPPIERIWSNVPLRNPNFTGRESSLQQLREELSKHAKASVLPQPLHGLGGMGKTQLAIEYTYRFAEEYDLVWWIPAERRSDLLASLAELGERLKVPAIEDLQQRVRVVLNKLSAIRRPWLLVYDNAGGPDDLNPFVPPAGGGHVILTSRDVEWTTDWHAIEVDVFQRKESIELLRKRDPQMSDATARQLAEKLGDLPLAVEQAVNFQLATGMQVGEYLQLFDKRVRELLNEGKPSGYHTTITAFVTLAFNRLQGESPAAAELLELFAYLGPEPVSTSLLRKGRSADLSPMLRHLLEDSIQTHRAIGDLARFGLAKIDPTSQHIQVHRLFQSILRSILDEERQAQALENARNLIGAANPGHPDDTDTWPDHAGLGPHIMPADLIHASTPQARLVVLDQARYLFQTGDYAGSRVLAEAMVTTWSKPPEKGGLGPDNEQTIIAHRDLANALRMLGDYSQARQLDDETFRRLRANPDFGDDHEHTIRVAFGLGFDYSINNDLEAALASDLENLDRVTRVYGDGHQYTLNARNNVAATLRQLGRFQEAHDRWNEIIEGYSELFGRDKPITLKAIGAQVGTLYGLGRYREALEVQTGIWNQLTRWTRPGQRDYLTAERNIAIAQRKLGNYEEALIRTRDNYNAFRTHFSADHEQTLAAAMGYANALRAAGQLPKARILAADTVEAYKKKFGKRHRLTLAAQVNQGIILRLLGEHQTAYALERDTYHALRGLLGEEHPYTLCAANNFASSMFFNHEVDASHSLTVKTLDFSRRVRGEDHPDTLACAVNAALDLQYVEGDAVVQQGFGEVRDALERVLGRDHPDTIDAIRGKRADCDIEPLRV